MKKVLSLVLVLVMALSLFAGCGSKAEPAATEAPAAAPATEAVAEAAPAEEVVITFGIHVANPESQEAVTYQIVEAFNAANAGKYKVEFQAADTESHKKNMKLQAADGTLPEIFWMDASQAPEYAEAGALLDMSDFLAAYADVDTALGGMEDAFNDGSIQYGLPYQCNVQGFFYNKAIFDAANVAYPTEDTTYDEFIEMIGQLKAAGTIPVSIGSKNSGFAMWEFNEFLSRYDWAADINELPFILYFYIDYEMYKEPLGADTAYFHASWHRENPCKGWGNELQVNSPEVNSVSNLKGENNYTVLDVEGCGHYVGCNLTVKHYQGSWWGEGDDMFFIDGEEYPSLKGTGTEDYFNHAWGMQRNAYPFFGTIVHEGDAGDFHVAYRFHITDPVHFEKHLRVSIEHGHANQLSDDWSSTAYWYQLIPTQTPLTILPVEERLPNVPQLHAPTAELPELTKEMRAARASWEHRWDEYSPERQEQFRIKEEKARRESRMNTEYAKQLRKDYNKK